MADSSQDKLAVISIFVVFIEDIVGGIITDFKVDLLLPLIDLEVKVLVNIPIAKAVRPWLIVLGAVGSGYFINLDKAHDQFITGIDIQHTISACPVLD